MSLEDGALFSIHSNLLMHRIFSFLFWIHFFLLYLFSFLFSSESLASLEFLFCLMGFFCDSLNQQPTITFPPHHCRRTICSASSFEAVNTKITSTHNPKFYIPYFCYNYSLSIYYSISLVLLWLSQLNTYHLPRLSIYSFMYPAFTDLLNSF